MIGLALLLLATLGLMGWQIFIARRKRALLKSKYPFLNAQQMALIELMVSSCDTTDELMAKAPLIRLIVQQAHMQYYGHDIFNEDNNNDSSCNYNHTKH